MPCGSRHFHMLHGSPSPVILRRPSSPKNDRSDRNGKAALSGALRLSRLVRLSGLGWLIEFYSCFFARSWEFSDFFPPWSVRAHSPFVPYWLPPRQEQNLSPLQYQRTVLYSSSILACCKGRPRSGVALSASFFLFLLLKYTTLHLPAGMVPAPVHAGYSKVAPRKIHKSRPFKGQINAGRGIIGGNAVQGNREGSVCSVATR
ncbi:hypothetical protein F4780DRAFT_141292 [Xylariomycetidae sp. FL0641]|nr:hypothetical protein F4780DRAFT_141292 [Xylariomycetidae sp. FL0641]